MGLFSWECKVCGLSLRTNSYIPHLTQAVAITSDGRMAIGSYDGYGNVGGMDIWESGEPDCYHRQCWKQAGQPTEYAGGSPSAADQGYFLAEDDPDIEYDKLQEREW